MTKTTVICFVCTDDLLNEEVIKVTPCGHAFHAGCIDAWHECSLFCPVCKEKIIDKYDIHNLELTTPQDFLKSSKSNNNDSGPLKSINDVAEKVRDIQDKILESDLEGPEKLKLLNSSFQEMQSYLGLAKKPGELDYYD